MSDLSLEPVQISLETETPQIVLNDAKSAESKVSQILARLPLKAEIGEFKKALDTVAQVAMSFMEMTGKGDFNYPMLSATSFLYILSEVVVAYYLLDQAVLAQGRLTALLTEKVDDPSQQKEFIKTNDEAAFLDGKIKTARFFVHQVLPDVRARAKSIQSGDRSALEIVF